MKKLLLSILFTTALCLTTFTYASDTDVNGKTETTASRSIRTADDLLNNPKLARKTQIIQRQLSAPVFMSQTEFSIGESMPISKLVELAQTLNPTPNSWVKNDQEFQILPQIKSLLWYEMKFELHPMDTWDWNKNNRISVSEEFEGIANSCCTTDDPYLHDSNIIGGRSQDKIGIWHATIAEKRKNAKILSARLSDYLKVEQQLSSLEQKLHLNGEKIHLYSIESLNCNSNSIRGKCFYFTKGNLQRNWFTINTIED